MAPNYRNSGASRRNNRGQIDHDIFEGLPVKNWRRETITVEPPPPPPSTTSQNKWDIELPYGMPKDSHLLPPHSQELLKLARSGKAYMKRARELDEEDVGTGDVEVGAGIEGKEKKEEVAVVEKTGYWVKTWKVARHADVPELDFLAKRRKGLKGAAVPGVATAMITKATVRKTDAQGNTYVEEVLVTEGQAVEGEIISSVIVADPNVVDLTPLRRRPAPPKRKPKGPGRGRKKKVLLPLPEAGAVPVKVEGIVPGSGSISNVAAMDTKPDVQNVQSGTQAATADAHMEDGEDDDGEDGEDGSEDEEDDEDGDDQDQDMADIDAPTPSNPSSLQAIPAPKLDLPAKPVFATVSNDNEESKISETVSEPTSDHHHDSAEAEAEGDDDDNIALQVPAQPTTSAHSNDIPTYYPLEPSISNMESPTDPQDFDENEEMLDLDAAENEDEVQQEEYTSYPPAQQSDANEQYIDPTTSVMDFAPDLPEETSSDATRAAAALDQQTSNEPAGTAEMFGDLLGEEDDFGGFAGADAEGNGNNDDGNEDVGNRDGNEEGNDVESEGADLMAGLDAHLLGVEGVSEAAEEN